jgi:valyl-tRNA synthetase
VKGWNSSAEVEQPLYATLAVEWFKSKLNATMAQVDDLMGKFRISEALMAIYKLFWDEFSSWYLEMIKPAYGSPIDKATLDATLGYFDTLLRLLHPFMPFITEELWQHLEERKEGDSIMLATLPKAAEPNESLIEEVERVKEIVAGVRTIRLQKHIATREPLTLQVQGAHNSELDPIILKMANLESIKAVDAKDSTAVSFRCGATEYSVPLAGCIDSEEELAKLRADLQRFQGFLAGVEKKLANTRFVENAPEAVVALERKKRSDAMEKIAAIEASIAALSK